MALRALGRGVGATVGGAHAPIHALRAGMLQPGWIPWVLLHGIHAAEETLSSYATAAFDYEGILALWHNTLFAGARGRTFAPRAAIKRGFLPWSDGAVEFLQWRLHEGTLRRGREAWSCSSIY